MESIERIWIHSTFPAEYKRTVEVYECKSFIIMSFYRINDPKKRDAMVEDYIQTVNRIKQRNLNDRLGDFAHQDALNETVYPIVEANKNTSNAITNELKPLTKELQELNNNLTGRPQAQRKLNVEKRDMYYGVHGDPNAGGYRLGDKKIEVDSDENIHVEGEIYNGTSGLWSLIFSVNPTVYTKADWSSYKKLVVQTDLINNPSGVLSTSRPSLTKKNKLIRQALEEVAEEEGRPTIREYGDYDRDQGTSKFKEEGSLEEEGHGMSTTTTTTRMISFLPSTIKGLFDKLKLLLAEFGAGNTTTRNEIVAIVDELRKRGRISEIEYTRINTLLSQQK